MLSILLDEVNSDWVLFFLERKHGTTTEVRMKCRVTIYFLSRRPVRRFIVASGSQLAGLRAVRKHGPDLPGARPRGFKNDVAAVRRPTGAFVASGVARQFDNLAAGDIHYVDVIVIVGPAPTKGEELS